MATHRHIDAVCVVITAFTLILTVLFMNGTALGIQAVSDEENSDAMFTQNDLSSDWDTSGATKITLSDEGSTVAGNGAYVNGGEVHIIYAGKYLLSGNLSDGSVIIEADGDDKIWLMFDGVTLHCEDSAALLVEQAEKVFITLKDGTENTLSSGSDFSEEAVSAGIDGTIYSRDDLTVNGEGALNITADYRHGIVCNDDLTITGGTITVTTAQDAIHANDSVRIKDADLTLNAGDDGITASNDDETSFIYIESGNISIPSCYEGLEAVQITIAGGTIDINPTDDGINANGYQGNSVINITGGEITVLNENGRDSDGIDSNKDIYISGGKLFVSVGESGGNYAFDYGSENGGICEITGGTVLACGSSLMAEGFDSSSSQGFIMQTVSAAAGTTVTVKDVDGNELFSKTVPYSFSSVLVSTPEMKVGDTCTLIVGDTETEITIDNSSAGGGFGGFGGGKMHGGNGFGNGQMPNRGGFGRNSGTDERGTAAETSDISTLSASADMPTVSLLSASGNDFMSGEFTPPEPPDGNAPPDFPGNGEAGGMQPPDMQGGTPPDFPDGDFDSMQPPEMPSDENMTPPDFPQGGEEDNAPPEIPQENESDYSQDEDMTLPDFLQDVEEGNTPPQNLQENETDSSQNDVSDEGANQDISQDEMNKPPQDSEQTDAQNSEADDLEQSGAEESMTPPDFQQGAAENESPFDLPQENMQDFMQNGQNFGGRQFGGNMRTPNGNQGQENIPQEADAASVSGKDLVLLAVSALVLLVGCMIAGIYRRRR